MPPTTECNTGASEQDKSRPRRSLVDYQASDFLKAEALCETKSSNTRLNTEKIRSYTEPDFIAEMWKAPEERRAWLKSLKYIFRRRKYARFTDEENADLSLDELPRVEPLRGSAIGQNEPALTPHKQSLYRGVGTGSKGAEELEPKSKVKFRTKILTRRSQRARQEEEPANSSKRVTSSSVFNDFGQIEASISFAAHVRRLGPGFSASCTQTLRTCDFSSAGDMFESEVQSNVTFNPLFEDDDSDDDKRVHPRRHRLYTIDEESEAYDSAS